MNSLKDLIEVTGSLVEEAWNCGRKEALRETGRKSDLEAIEDLQAQIEELRAENRKLRAVAQELLSGRREKNGR